MLQGDYRTQPDRHLHLYPSYARIAHPHPTRPQPLILNDARSCARRQALRPNYTHFFFSRGKIHAQQCSTDSVSQCRREVPGVCREYARSGEKQARADGGDNDRRQVQAEQGKFRRRKPRAGGDEKEQDFWCYIGLGCGSLLGGHGSAGGPPTKFGRLLSGLG